MKISKNLNKKHILYDFKKFVGDGGYRSPYLSHAKRALYHLSYVPFHEFGHSMRQCVPTHEGQISFSSQGHCQPIKATYEFWSHNSISPSIAQLVERWTVVVHCQISIGRWFKSGSKEFLFWISCFHPICWLFFPIDFPVTCGPGSSVGRALGF